MLSLTFKSLWSRRLTVSLTMFAIAISVALLLGVDKIRNETKSSFTNTISGTDIIIGARTGQTQLLLYSVFRIGNASNNISWHSHQYISSHPLVKWAIPISLGDSHHGYPVMGTDQKYFQYYRYSRNRSLAFNQGRPFNDLYDVVLGSNVASTLGYKLNDQLTLAHGMSHISFTHHDDKPFKVSGILSKTGTPVDNTVHISLQAMQAIHIDWIQGTPPQDGYTISAEKTRELKLKPKSITATLIGLKSKFSTFQLQRELNEYQREPLQAILPGLALQQLWQVIGVAEKALLTVSAFVLLAGLIGMLTSILTSLNERRREMAVLRSLGARPVHIFTLLIIEAVLIAMLGSLLGIGALYCLLIFAQPLIENYAGVYLSISSPGWPEATLLSIILLLSLLMGCIPALRAYHNSLADGMSFRL